MADTIIVNNYYPIGYFSTVGLNQSDRLDTEQFWASQEQPPPTQEWLHFDLGRERPVNFIDFEISQKPIDFKIEYDDAGVWKELTPSEYMVVSMSVNYFTTLDNPWHYFEMYFNLQETRYIRITFTRREDPFPFSDSDPFPWSIEVRNLRLMHVIPTADEFVADSGTDLFGNGYITSLEQFPASNVTDGSSTTYWQSQPNPSRFAVESLYFDLRWSSQVVTMGYLDEHGVGVLDGRSMADMENYAEEGVVLDEIFIDPVTFGPSFHIYYSNDDEADWDNKLWTPVPRHYILKRGYHALPSPTYVKYVKLEFSNLAATPYNTIDYPVLPPVTYRKYPTWVQNYFNNQYIYQVDNATFFNPAERIQIDPLKLGFTKPVDLLAEGSFETIRVPTQETTTAEIKDYIDTLNQGGISESQNEVESRISYRPSFAWQQDFIQQLDETRALSRVAKDVDTGWSAEEPLTTEQAPTLQSVPDLTAAEAEKTQPIMWFPRTCRHGYQVVRTLRDTKIAYFVAIREVTFYRKDYTIQFDEPFYIETLDDNAHVQSSDFTREDWRFVIEP